MIRFAVGSYTSPKGHHPDAQGRGLSVVEYTDGPHRILHEYRDVENPSYMCMSQTHMYVSSEDVDFDMVGIFKRELDSSLSFIGTTGKSHHDACHMSMSPDGNQLYTSSYGGGYSTAYSIDSEGMPRKAQEWGYSGSGPNRDRQESPHAHQILHSHHNDHVYICDLGTDKIWGHSSENFSAGPDIVLELPPGCGPRHAAIDPEIPLMYILCELIPIIIVAAINVQTSELTIVQQIPSVAAGGSSTSAPAAIKIHPSGNTLAVSNRFWDSVDVFEIHRDSSHQSLKYLTGFGCGGKTPRDISFSPDGSLLLIANQDSHNIAVVQFNSSSGRPADEKNLNSFPIGSPVCILPL